jgi:UrcA family protein
VAAGTKVGGKDSHPGSARESADEPPNVIVGAHRRDDDVLTKRVSLRDLDLNTKVGACTALKRLKRAADAVCPFEDRPLDQWIAHRQCLKESLSRAVHDVHNRKLDNVYASRSNGC